MNIRNKVSISDSDINNAIKIKIRKKNTMRKITVNASLTYDIIIDNGILDKAGELSENTVPPCHAAVLTDDIVGELYKDRLINSLEAVGYTAKTFIIPHGEKSKSAKYYIEFLNFLANRHITRSDCIFALGGGVVGDLAGFAAATFLRGIKFIQIPTTLLAMVDSSVGGKTAIDLDAGKNLAGAFYQPSLVICDYSTLNTLNECIFRDGCAEVIKYGIINDRPLFEKLKNPIMPQIEDIIANCVQNKRDIVNLDERDNGIRQLLNLGHTAAHAIEQNSDFEISHGSAVSIGTAIIARAAARLGICPEDDRDEIINLLSQYNLPTKSPYNAQKLAEVSLTDKKRNGKKINLIMPFGIGNSRIYPVDVYEIERIFALGL